MIALDNQPFNLVEDTNLLIHSGLNILEKLQFGTFPIKNKNLLVKDETSNMFLGIDLAQISLIHCTIHLF